MREIRERIKTTLGGIYDPMTGESIKEKVNTLSELSRNEYLAAHKVDALLESAIVLRSADVDFNEARWDGVTESSTGRSAAANFMRFMMTGGTAVSGQAPALSFVARLTDTAGKILYTGAGGLQVLGYARIAVQKTLLTTIRQQDVSATYIMADPARDARALSLALDPLVHGSAPATIKIASVPADVPGTASASLAVSRDGLMKRFPRLALGPLEFQTVGERDEEVRLRYRGALTQGLTQLGFEVVGGDDYGRQWDAERVTAGGYFDPFTGRLDKVKLKESRLRVFESMREHQAVTAVVLPRVVGRAALFSSGVAEWDGTKESLTPSKSRLGALFDPSRNNAGRLSAMSLEVLIIDPGGDLLFEGMGGIQLTERYSGSGREPLTGKELFSDPGKDKRAVDIALATLAAAPTSRP